MKASFFLILRVVLGTLFISSGYTKLMQPYQNFLAVVNGFELVVGPLAVFVAHVVPWTEFILGIFLVIGLWSRTALVGLWFLNTVFIAVTFSALVRNLPIKSCGCFGERFQLSLRQILVLDLFFWSAFTFLFVYLENTLSCSVDRFLDRKK